MAPLVRREFTSMQCDVEKEAGIHILLHTPWEERWLAIDPQLSMSLPLIPNITPVNRLR
jgi:hypothetical protein